MGGVPHRGPEAHGTRRIGHGQHKEQRSGSPNKTNTTESYSDCFHRSASVVPVAILAMTKERGSVRREKENTRPIGRTPPVPVRYTRQPELVQVRLLTPTCRCQRDQRERGQTSLTVANWTSTTLIGTDLGGTTLTDADVTGTNLTDVNQTGADEHVAPFDPRRLRRIRRRWIPGGGRTRSALPPGLRVRAFRDTRTAVGSWSYPTARHPPYGREHHGGERGASQGGAGLSWSGWRDLNSRPLDPQSSALTKLRHSPYVSSTKPLASRPPADQPSASFGDPPSRDPDRPGAVGADTGALEPRAALRSSGRGV